MASRQAEDLVIDDLRGGMNNSDPPHALADDECVLAENVEWFNSTLGERRAGTATVSLTSSSLGDETVVVHVSQWFPSNVPTLPEHWAISVTPGVSVSVARRYLSVWNPVTPSDTIHNTVPDIYGIRSQALGGLLFWTYASDVDRLHVWDGTTLRRTGLAQPSPPTGADTGSGSYATARYFRVRFVQLNISSQAIRRSEPSTALTFTPSGSGSGVIITMPALLSEGETHWEVEASTDNVTFYRIARQAVGSTTYTDSTAFASGYASQGPVSEVIGTYLLQPSAKYIAVDGDRLLLAGHWTDASLQSTVWWTPVSADPGAGNSERLPLNTNNSENLDGNEGGPITGIGSSVYGIWYVFKWSHIYRMVRTGDVTRAYASDTLSKSRGAIPGSVIPGSDENGNPCLYFLDPQLGPSRLGNFGLQTIHGMRGTWDRINLLATSSGHGVYYAAKHQVHWWIAIDGATTPNYELVLQVSEMKSNGGSASRGWSVATGVRANAVCSAILTEQVFIDSIQYLSDRPFVGLPAPYLLQQCDVSTMDAGVPYVAKIRTKPYIVAGLLNRWGAMLAALLATAVEGASIVIRLIRDYGLEDSEDINVDMSPTGDESMVVKKLDNLRMSGACSVQVEFSDE
jgi:hypothetical protein